MKKKILGIMGVVGLLFAGCSSEDDFLSSFHNDPNAVHITAEVGKASADGFTRSNPLGDAEAQKKFNTDDEISVKADGQAAVTYKLVGNEWQPQGGKFLKWESETMNFTAYYPASYHGGTISQPTEYTTEASLAAADYMSFIGSQKNPGDNTLTLSMNRQMARVVVDIFGFNDQYAKDTPVNSVSIKGVKAYKHSDNKFYALMKPCTADNNAQFLSLEVGEGNNTETLTGIPELEAGKSYTYQLTVGKNKVSVTGITVKDWTTGQTIEGGKTSFIPYVTFMAKEEQTFNMTTRGNYTFPDLEYSVGTGDWIKLKGTDEITFGGDKGNLQLRGKNPNGTATDNSAYSTINFTKPDVKVACTGDIRTLLNWENYKTVETKDARFCNLFVKCVALTSAPELPATTLAKFCYNGMFKGCTTLEKAPELPATTLASDCYSMMFWGCTNLNKAPELPATTLAKFCYNGMFKGCTTLEKAPELPATILEYSCYNAMFFGCKKLNTAPELPATKLAEKCYYDMFDGCENLNTAPELPATKLEDYCYNGMFKGCTTLEKAPELPAETLASHCYSNMFQGCTTLEKAPELPATTLASECYSAMFRGCTNLSSVTMLAPSNQITSAYNCCYSWLEGAGTAATSRTLILKDEAAYNALENNNYLPAIWKKDQCTVSYR